MTSTMTKTLLAALLAASLSACGGSPSDRTNLEITAPKATVDLGRMVVDVQPANLRAELPYDAARGVFRGGLAVPAGRQELRLTALRATTDLLAADDAVLGEGSATVDVEPDRVASVYVEILLAGEPPPPAPDHSPIITSFYIADSAPAVHEPVLLRVAAVDPDGDEITYEWSATCEHEFSLTTPEDGYLVIGEEGSCTVRVTATANGLTDEVQATIATAGHGAGDGSVVISTGFVTVPWVAGVDLSGEAFGCNVLRISPDATCRDEATRSAGYDLWVSATSLPDGAEIVVVDDCGGSAELRSPGQPEWFYWTAPAASGVCMIEAGIWWRGQYDSMSIAVFVP